MLNETREATIQCWNVDMHKGKQMQEYKALSTSVEATVKNARGPRETSTWEHSTCLVESHGQMGGLPQFNSV